jgi:hypothetical protein
MTFRRPEVLAKALGGRGSATSAPVRIAPFPSVASKSALQEREQGLLYKHMYMHKHMHKHTHKHEHEHDISDERLRLYA